MIFDNIEERAKEIFGDILVKVSQVNNPDIRHIYLNKNIEGTHILELQKNFRILFISTVHEEERLDQNFDAIQVILIAPLEDGIHRGSLPEVCPKCKVKVEWDWEMCNFYDDQHVNEATCPNCHTQFSEIMEVTSWEYKHPAEEK